MPLIREYVQPLPALAMATAHYFDVVPEWFTPVEHGDYAVYRHRNFLPYYFRYLVQRWRILIALNGADALGAVDIDMELAMTRRHYDRQHGRLVRNIAAQLFAPRGDDFFLDDVASTDSDEDSSDDESWLQ